MSDNFQLLIEIEEQTLLHTDESTKIERQYPIKNREVSYPKRYDTSVFEMLNKINTDTKLQDNYKKWKDGINYNTNRKITIGGKIHNELKRPFIINGGILFDELNNINICEYLQETEKINKGIDEENIVIKDYNKLIDNIIEKIESLEMWSEFIEFGGKKYGLIRKIKYGNNDNHGVHIENDCLGEMVFTYKETEWHINDRPYCNYADREQTYSIYKCAKCNYENKVYEPQIVKTTDGYTPKNGFWWK